MAKSNRQKYNFLAAWVSQLDQAMDEDDDLAGQAAKVIGLDKMARSIGELNERCDKCEQWLADLESALEELDSGGRESSGEELEPDDDGDYDDELEGVEPPVERTRQGDRRVAGAVGSPSIGEVDGRGVASRGFRPARTK